MDRPVNASTRGRPASQRSAVDERALAGTLVRVEDTVRLEPGDTRSRPCGGFTVGVVE
jgi:hypothetical protein